MSDVMPLLDCLIPVCKPSPFLEPSLESVLAQSFSDFRLLLFSSQPDPKTLKVIEKIQKKDSRVFWFSSKKDLSTPEVLNILVKKAKAKYTAFQYPSDLSNSKRFEVLLKRLKESSLVGLGSSVYWDQTQLGGPIQEIKMPQSPKEVLYAQIGSEEMRGLFLFSSMYKTKELKKTALFSPLLPFEYDIEFNAKMQIRYPLRLANIEETLYTIKLYKGCLRDLFRKENKKRGKSALYPLIAPALFAVKHYFYDNTLLSSGYLPY